MSASITTSAPLLLLKPLYGADKFSAGNTHISFQATEPLFALGVPKDACLDPSAPYTYGSSNYICERIHIGDLSQDVSAAQTLTVEGVAPYSNRPMPEGVPLAVLGRWNPGDTAQIDNVNGWARVYLVRPEALSYPPGQPPKPKTLTVNATVEVKSCSVIPPYDPSAWPAAQTPIQEHLYGACGDGLLRASEPCDDGNADPNDGCDIGYASYGMESPCKLSVTTCSQDLAATWKAWRCAGSPSVCAQIDCPFGTQDPDCLDLAYNNPIPSPNTSATVKVVLNGRTEGETPHQSQVLIDAEGPACACTDTGWDLSCDPACTWNKPCARPQTDLTNPLTLSRWEGCTYADNETGACVIGNLTHTASATAVFSSTIHGEVGARLRPLANPQETPLSVTAAAAHPNGAVWMSVLTRTQANQEHTRLLYAPSPEGPLHEVPMVHTSTDILSIRGLAPSADGQSVWVEATFQGQASFDGRAIEPPPLPGTLTRRLAAHISAEGELLGVFFQGQEGDITDSAAQIAASPTGSAWSAVLAYTDPAQGELILVALDAGGRKVWQRILRNAQSAPFSLYALQASASEHLALSFASDAGPLDASPFEGIGGQSGPLLLGLSPAGDLLWSSPWQSSTLATTALDGFWTLGFESGTTTARLRLYDAQSGDMQRNFDIGGAFGLWPSLWPQADGDLILARPDSLGGLVVSRWQTDGLLARRWLERIDLFYQFNQYSALSAASTPAAVHILGYFSDDAGEVTLSVPLQPF